MANELHNGSLIIPKTSLSWQGAGSGGLSLFLEENFGKTEIIAPANRIELSFDVDFGRTNDLMYHTASYGGSFGIIPRDDLDGYFFKFPKRGNALINLDGYELGTQKGEAIAFRGPTLRAIQYENKFSESQISFAAMYCVERLSCLIDGPVMKPLVFKPKVELYSSPVGKLASLSHFLSETNFGDVLGVLPPRAARVSTLVVDIALSVWPHNYLDELQKRPPSIAPRHVKAAIEYVRSHPAELTSPDELARLSGVSVRSLQYSFKDVTGLTITDYQKALRLKGARDAIINSSQPIRDIAQNWGFYSSGRFSAYFRQAYGVSPNELRRGGAV